MRVTRRGLIAGLAATGVAVPAGIYAQRKWLPRDEPEPEPSVSTPPLPQALLAHRLVGIWDFELLQRPATLAALPGNNVQLLLDVGPGGRALRGCLLPAGGAADEWQLYGELSAAKLPKVRWKLTGPQHSAFECVAALDELWGGWSMGGGAATLTGTLCARGVQAGHSAAQAKFMARKRPFIEARERLHYAPELHAWLVSLRHRLFHQLWHASRDRWHELSDDNREVVRILGWQPGAWGAERDARGEKKHRNGSGEDFLFMHRRMLGQVRALQDFPSWTSLPLPRPYLGHDCAGFVDYMSNADGRSVPPAWEADGDDDFNRWLHGVKSDEGYYGNFQLWEAQYQDPDYLSTLCLGEFGSRVELGVHDWLHMRWASLCRDPHSGLPMVYDRDPVDFSPRWLQPQNDYLGDPFSSHLNPVFWYFHGWIDDRIEDWFLAHQRAHPGQVKRSVIDGVPWFAPGPWVRVAKPWLGPSQQGCGAWLSGNGGGSELDIETMKLALRIIFGDDKETTRLRERVPRRPWYGRHLAPGPTST